MHTRNTQHIRPRPAPGTRDHRRVHGGPNSPSGTPPCAPPCPPPCGPQPGAGSGASRAGMPAGRGMAASGSGGGPAADGAPCPPMTSAGSTTRCHLRHTASASPRRTACDTAMRTSGAKRGTAHVAQSSSDTGTEPPARLPRSARKRIASGPKAPPMEVVSGMRRMRGGSAPYSVRTQCEAMESWAAWRRASVCWEATWDGWRRQRRRF